MRPQGQVTGELTISGLLRKTERKRGYFAPENNPTSEKWYSVDVLEMAHHRGTRPIMLDAVYGGDPSALPVGGQGFVELTNPHLNYAITWYSLTFFLAFMSWRLARGSPLTKASASLLNVRQKY
jgi:surfeit locus 1 family protein